MSSGAAALAGGLLVGLAVAASPGPLFFLVLRRTLERGRPSGLASGAGVATGDAAYALVAALGLGLVSTLLSAKGRWVSAAGAGALVAIGLRTLLARPTSRPAPAGGRGGAGLAADYISTLGLTLGNPPTIVTFAAVFAGLAGSLSRLEAGWLVAGVTAGSAAWWLILTVVAGWLRGRLTESGVAVVRSLSGLVITVFGLVAAVSALRP